MQTLSGVVTATKIPAEKTRLEAKLQQLQHELVILDQRQAIEERERALRIERNVTPIEALREKLRSVDRTVDEAEARVKELMSLRRQAVTERNALANQVNAGKTDKTATVDRRVELDEKLFTKNEELRAIALEREAAESEVDLAREADRIREKLKSIEVTARPTLRLLFENFSRLREEQKTSGQVAILEGNLQQNLRVSQGALELSQQKLAKFDEELTLLEKQTGFFTRDPRIESLLATQKGQKNALGERMPFIIRQVEAIKQALQALRARKELISTEAGIQQDQFEALKTGYLRRLRWPGVALGTLLILHVVISLVLLPAFYRNEALFMARRLESYLLLLAIAGVIAGFLFDDLSMVAATLGVVSAALVISLQDVCTSMCAWFVIMIGRKFTIGDRLEIDGIRGDVIDIQLLRTTFLEVNGWLGIDQPTGRVIVVPNNFVFKSKVFNFTHGHPYIWGKIDVTVTFSTPVVAAMELFELVLEQETRETFAQARQAADSMQKRYGVEDADYHPKIYTHLAENGVAFSLFYVAHYREYSAMRNKLNHRLIVELEQHKEINLAYNTMKVVDERTIASPVSGQALSRRTVPAS